MLNCVPRSAVAAISAAMVAFATNASGQVVTDSVVVRCVRGDPQFETTDSQAARGELDRLLWRKSYADYVRTQTTRGALAAFDSITARTGRLLTEVGGPGALQPVANSLQDRFVAARADLAQHLTPDGLRLRDREVVQSVPFQIEASTQTPGRVRLGLDASFDIDATNRLAVVAICAGANTAQGFLESLMKDEFKRVAAGYARTVKEWDMFVESGYSMTLVERLAASCRLWIIGRIINPLRNCSKSPDRSLGPPRHQWVFVHPSAGLAPLFKKDSLYQALGIVEWYGYMGHVYGESDVKTIGVTFASSYVDAGKAGYGGVLRTPWGSLGMFGRKSNGPLYTVSADVLGWIPSVRRGAETLRLTPLQNALSKFAAP